MTRPREHRTYPPTRVNRPALTAWGAIGLVFIGTNLGAALCAFLSVGWVAIIGFTGLLVSLYGQRRVLRGRR